MSTAAAHRSAPSSFGCGDFALLATGSFAATVGGVLVVIRVALCIARLLGWRLGGVGGGGGAAVVRPDGAAGLSPEQRAGIDALRSAAVRRRLGRQRAAVDVAGDPDDDGESCCAICHECYLPSDAIVRSSDPLRCRHAFHEGCMVAWLVSSGWTRSVIDAPKALSLVIAAGMGRDGGGGDGGGGATRTTGEEEDDDHDGDLLDYDLECPCCRQVFVDRTLPSPV
jgi:hypothetical protein